MDELVDRVRACPSCGKFVSTLRVTCPMCGDKIYRKLAERERGGPLRWSIVTREERVKREKGIAE